MINFYKQPIEKYSKGFRPDLPDSVTVSSVAVAAVNNRTGATDNSVIGSTTGTVLESGAAFAVTVQNGTDGQDYKISFTYTCSDGEIRQEDLLMLVREI